jgi:hypothetical protein
VAPSGLMKTRKLPTLVPKAVFGLTVVGVVPACVLLGACGGGQQEMPGVAAPAFTASSSGNGQDAAPPAETATSSASAPPPPMLGVAAPAFSVTNPQR